MTITFADDDYYVCLVPIKGQSRSNRVPGVLQETWDLLFSGLRRSGRVSWENAELDQFRAIARGVVPLPYAKGAPRCTFLFGCRVCTLNARRFDPACDLVVLFSHQSTVRARVQGINRSPRQVLVEQVDRLPFVRRKSLIIFPDPLSAAGQFHFSVLPI